MNINLEQYEQLNPGVQIERHGKHMAFATPSMMTKWRVDTILKKEPCTIEWIENFAEGDILLDVGANVGMYSIWAAAVRGVRVFAFEPEAKNYALLNKNIAMNGLQHLVMAYCAGLSDQQGLTKLNMADLRAGGSNHALGEPLNFKNEPLKPIFVQGSVGFTVDSLTRSGDLPIPTHLKIDVDGIEHRVIGGSMQTLKNEAVRSLLIETNLNLESHRSMVAALNKLGFKHDADQVNAAMRKDGQFAGVAEHIFRR
jgi:FkbM family methyltransferase